jgi:hypothetical protein
MRKLVLTLLLFILISTPTFAKNIKVEALSDFSTATPPKTWKLKIVDGFVEGDGYVVCADSILEGNIESITQPKRLKRNATFEFIPTKYYDSSTGKTYPIKQDIVGQYSCLNGVTVGSVVKQGAVMAGSHFICGFIGPGVALVEGAVKNEEGNIAKSAAVSVYESTPLSYVGKGKELEFKQGQVFIMNFKMTEEVEQEENKPNFEYTIEE